MSKFFCAEESRKSAEDPIGNGENVQTYVFIECPPPWTREAFNSKQIPQNLRDLQQELASNHQSIEFLLIFNEEIYQFANTRVLIFSQVTGFSHGYDKYEFSVGHIQEVAPIIKRYLLAQSPDIYPSQSTIEDIFICTHGSRDKCCAKYGNPFYRQTKNIVKNLSLSNVRIWQTSHFGGHRFAPTAITFPDGRYYARLDEKSITSILTHTGELDFIYNVYRGWGILPPIVQVLEREMMLIYGWDWFNYKVNYQIIEQSQNTKFNRLELSFIKPNGAVNKVEANIVLDESRAINLIGSCDSSETENIPQFRVENLLLAVH